MRRTGIHAPTVEDAAEISGIETLHPGGFALTRRTAEVAGLRPGLRVLDVSSGRGTQAVFYAVEYGVDVTGVDLSPEMVRKATERAASAGVSERVRFAEGDSQALPWPDGTFDVVINECAVGIPDDSQAVVREMARVVKPGGRVVIHESTWRKSMTACEKDDLAERYGTRWSATSGRACSARRASPRSGTRASRGRGPRCSGTSAGTGRSAVRR
jgi:ubiquinone/menaquinone biosynthesis C-methylase UbiE